MQFAILNISILTCLIRYLSIALCCTFLLDCDVQAQKKDSTKLHFLEKSPQLHKGRVIGLSTTAAISYSSFVYGLSQYWYKNFQQTNFHFYNDNGEWNQMDKVGHAWTAYAESLYMIELYRWAGLKDKKAIWIGGVLGSTYQATIEVLDGYSAKWGASPTDIMANTLGVVMVMGQEFAWKEQRIQFKFSTHPVQYNAFAPEVQMRTQNLYGTSFAEKVLKDYNGQTYWLAVNPFHFKKNSTSTFPKWLNIAVGYGVDNILGGFENEWTTPEGIDINRTDIARLRQYYLALDIDFTQIPTNSRFLKTFFKALNILKFPSPALELNSEGEWRGHWLYF